MTVAEFSGGALALVLTPLERGFTVRTPSPHQVQVMQDGAVFADWWPSKGTTMVDGVRGPKCKTPAEVERWLVSL